LEIPLERGEEDVGEALSELGIECRVLNRILAIDALPPLLEAAHFSQFFDLWKAKKELAQTATHFCRRMRKEYSMEEAVQLWRRLQSCKDGRYDPLGHLIWCKITMDDFEALLRKNG
jgi:hypothetical protein